jgi:hypothetical protein
MGMKIQPVSRVVRKITLLISVNLLEEYLLLIKTALKALVPK